MKKLGLMILISVLLFALVVAPGDGGSDGETFCEDVEGEVNHFVKGVVEGKKNGDEYRYEDHCKSGDESGKFLIEKKCDGDYMTYDTVECDGYCEDGACVESNETDGENGTVTCGKGFQAVNFGCVYVGINGCYDSDTGKNYYFSGKVTIGEDSWSDHCNDDPYKLTEKYCNDDGSLGAVSYECDYKCYEGRCLKEGDGEKKVKVTESVKCVFKGDKEMLEKEQKCYIASDKVEYSCKTQFYDDHATCVIDVKGYKGEKMTWKSSCGGYAYTKMDGENEYAEFKCKAGEVEDVDLEKKGFRGASWECYDGEVGKLSEGKCMGASYYKKKALKYCDSKCNGEKCGVNSFAVLETCYLGEEDDSDASESGGDVEIGIVCKDSCALDGRCYDFGYRKSGKYCFDEEGIFVEQKDGAESCDNDFECSSNVCVNSECVSQGLIKKILSWLSGLFS